MLQKKSCKNCLKGTMISVNNDILCREKGVVSPDYLCINHRHMPESKSYRQMNYKCIQCDYFVVSDNNPQELSSTGLCQLFSVRKFDGEQKNACSKFTKKVYSNVL